MAMASSKDDTTGGGDKGAEAASTPAMPEDAGEARVDDPKKLRPEKQPETKPSIAGSNRTTEEIERRMVEEGAFDENFVSLKEDCEEMLPEILGLYITDGEETTSDLLKLSEGEGVEALDFGSIQELVHRFKGSSLSIGVAQVCLLCKEIRETCVQKKGLETKQKLSELRTTFVELRGNLEAYLDSLGRKRLKMGNEAT